jgi:hypothetical protein
MSLKPFFLSLGAASLFATVTATGALAQDTAEFEGEVDRAIRSACHGFMVDALPDAVSWLRDAIYENSPFCRRIQGAADQEAFGEAVQDAFADLGPDDVRLDLSQERDRDLNVTIECDSEYMCMETRLAFQETDTPVSQRDYDTVGAYCDGRYGCIQAYFRNWPAPLPTPMPIARAEMTRFGHVIPPPAPPAAPAAPEQVVEQAAEPAPEPSVAALPEPAEPASDSGLADRIAALNASLTRSCRCSLSGAPCFDNPYGPVRSHIQAVEDQRRRQCIAWDTTTSDGVAPDVETADRLAGIQSAVADADARGAGIIQLAAEDFRRIQDRVARGQPFVDTLEVDKIEALAAEPPATGAPRTAAAPSEIPPAEPAETAPAEDLFVLGPRLVWGDATAYCERLGRRLPTVAEGRALHDKIQEADWWFGMWTSYVSYSDAFVQRIRTVRPGGWQSTENGRSWQALTVCVE